MGGLWKYGIRYINVILRPGTYYFAFDRCSKSSYRRFSDVRRNLAHCHPCYSSYHAPLLHHRPTFGAVSDYRKFPSREKRKQHSTFPTFLVHYGVARYHTKMQNTSTKPGPVNSLESITPNSARSDIAIAPPHVNFKCWTFKFGKEGELGILKKKISGRLLFFLFSWDRGVFLKFVQWLFPLTQGKKFRMFRNNVF